jgi:hypothetical protein
LGKEGAYAEVSFAYFICAFDESYRDLSIKLESKRGERLLGLKGRLAASPHTYDSAS